MKKIYALGLSLILTALLAANVSAQGGFLKWQIGTPDGDVNPIVGSLEYPASNIFYPVFDYTVGVDADPIFSPSLPGYIGSDTVCNISPRSNCTDTAQVINIHFDLACDYSSGGLTLIYDRYGSEADILYLDGVNFATVSASEGGFNQFTFDLAAEAGSHILTFEYENTGGQNGHYIDYLALETNVDDGSCGKAPEKITVEIDIKPGSYPSCFNNDGHGVIPVAIFGSSEVDVYSIDPASLQLEGLPVATRGKSLRLLIAYEDLNGDGYTDLLVKFKDIAGVFTTKDKFATLTGFLMDGITPIEGVGDICITQDNVCRTFK